MECLAWIARGKSRCEIAHLLDVPKTSIDAHIQAACERLGVETPLEAALVCAELGLIGEVANSPAA